MLRSLRSFGFHKSPKTREKNGKKNVTYRTEKNGVPNPELKARQFETNIYTETVLLQM